MTKRLKILLPRLVAELGLKKAIGLKAFRNDDVVVVSFHTREITHKACSVMERAFFMPGVNYYT